MTTGKGDCPLSEKSPLFVQCRCRVTSLEPVCRKKDKASSIGVIYTFVHAYLCLDAAILIKGNRKTSVEDGA